jgi:hypothetical protein
MPKKKSKVDRGKRKGRMGTDPVSVQIGIKAQVPRGYRLSPQFMEKVVHNWAETGETPVGIEVNVIKWRNPARKGAKGGWRSATTKNERQCKLIRRLLRGTSARLEITSVG